MEGIRVSGHVQGEGVLGIIMLNDNVQGQYAGLRWNIVAQRLGSDI